MRKICTFLVFVVLFNQAHSQFNVSIHWGTEPLSLDKYYLLGKDSLMLHELKFYLSDFQFENENRKHVLIGPYLIDLKDSNSLQLFSDLQIDNYQSLHFKFGLDSFYQVSEIVDGPLNPMNGMYWAWNSGYIQFKCIGTTSSISQMDQTFEYHLGGYRRPFETLVPIQLAILGNTLILDIKPFFERTVDFSLVQRVMIPGKIAQNYCRDLSKYFRTE